MAETPAVDAAGAPKAAAAAADAPVEPVPASSAAASAPPVEAAAEGAPTEVAPAEDAAGTAAAGAAPPAAAAETPPPSPPAELGTGSVVLFYYNDHLLTRLYAWLAGKKCAHVGVVVKDPKYPKKREGLFLLESGFEGFDTGKTPTGVRLVPLAEAVADYGSSMVYVRHLVAKPEGFALGPLLSELTSRTPCGQQSAWRDQYKAAGLPRAADADSGADAADADATCSDLAGAAEPAEEAAAPADWSAALAAYVFGSFGGAADAWRTAEPGLFDTADEALPPFPGFKFAPAVPLDLPAPPAGPAK